MASSSAAPASFSAERLPDPARIMNLGEVAAALRADPGFAGSSVRVLGKLVESSSSDQAVLVEFDKVTARVNLDAVKNGDLLRSGCLYQFLGEVLPARADRPDVEVWIRARICRNVDGLDLNLYRQSLQVRRDFERAQEQALASRREQ